MKKEPKKDTKEKVAEAKKASRKADKVKQANEAKKVGEQVILKIAAGLAAGEAKTLLTGTAEIRKQKAIVKQANLVIRGVRGSFKEMKINLKAYDHAFKMAEMDAEDLKAFKATSAIYEEQLGLELSPAQEAMVKEINDKREAAKKSMLEMNGGSTGKEIGSGTAPDEEPGEDAAKPEDGDDAETGTPAVEAPKFPEKNTALSSAFRIPVAATPATAH